MDIERTCHPQRLQLHDEETLLFAGLSDQRNSDLNEQVARYHDFSTRCLHQEIAVVITVLICFAMSYLFCYLTGIEYGTFLHGKILYAVFVIFNVYAAGQAFYSWAVLANKSVARDYMFFWAVAFTGAALGNSIDYLLWVSETALFKQNMLTNLIFVFSLILSFPGIYFLAQVCQVKITRQPMLYSLPLVHNLCDYSDLYES